MKVALLTREFPPEIYGGAGVHVGYLARELTPLCELSVHCWGVDRPTATAHRPWEQLAGDAPHLAALRAISVDLAMAAAVKDADIVHSHTWYANLAGHLAKLTFGIPHVATVHSLEPLRPWKAEQLGGGYALSSWCERTALEAADAVIAVSEGMRRDVLACYTAIDPARVSVIYNGIDTEEYSPDSATAVLDRLGIDLERPIVVFVGRITRQKGVPYLLAAAREFTAGTQLVLCAGAPDTPELGAEVARAVAELDARRGDVIWIEEFLPRRDLVQLLSHATVFACPSIYEPLGIVNLEAMACEAAVVASATGGIVEVVDDGVTGLLVDLQQREGEIEPADPAKFSSRFAAAVNDLVADPGRARAMGRAGRVRAAEHFSWPAIARSVVDRYGSVLAGFG